LTRPSDLTAAFDVGERGGEIGRDLDAPERHVRPEGARFGGHAQRCRSLVERAGQALESLVGVEQPDDDHPRAPGSRKGGEGRHRVARSDELLRLALGELGERAEVRSPHLAEKLQGEV